MDLNKWMVGLGLYVGNYHMKEINDDFCVITDVPPSEINKLNPTFELKIWFGNDIESRKLKRILQTLNEEDPERNIGLKYEFEIEGRIISYSPGLKE